MRATRRKRRQATAEATPAQIMADAARRWNVPLWALVGVKLSESGSATSFDNLFELEPATASSLGVKDTSNWSESANGAARLLSEYHHQFGTWNAAFEAYNGGPGAVGRGYAYDEAHVKSKLAEFGVSDLASTTQNVSFLGEVGKGFEKELEGLFVPHGPKLPLAPEAPGLENNPLTTESPLNGFGGLGQIGSAISALTNIQTWIRIGEVIAGAVLIVLALKALTGADLPAAIPIPV